VNNSGTLMVIAFETDNPVRATCHRTGTRTGPHSVRFPAAVIETNDRHRQLILALLRRAASHGHRGGAARRSTPLRPSSAAAGRYARCPCLVSCVPVSYCLGPVSYLHVDRDSTWEVADRYRQVRDRCLEARRSRAFTAPWSPKGRGLALSGRR